MKKQRRPAEKVWNITTLKDTRVPIGLMASVTRMTDNTSELSLSFQWALLLSLLWPYGELLSFRCIREVFLPFGTWVPQYQELGSLQR